VPNMYVTLGPDNKSYWASDGMSYICSNLPSGLDAEIEKLRKPEGGFRYQPRIVALGIDGTYVMANSGNGGCWDLKNHYPALDMELDRFKAETLGKGGMFQPIEVRVPVLCTLTAVLMGNLVSVLESTPWRALCSGNQERRVLGGCSR